MRYLLLFVALTACKPTPAPAPMPPAVVETIAAIEPDGGATATPPSVALTGEPVAVSTPETLHERGGLDVLRQNWEFDGTRGVAWLVRVPRAAPIEVVPSDDVVPFDDLLPDDAGPWAAINGGFYEAADAAYRPMGLVVSDGNVTSELTRRGGSGVFYVDETGPHVVHRKDFSASPTHGLQSIDRIVDAGASVVTQRPGQPTAMRSAVAISADHVWLVALAADSDIKSMPDGALLTKSGAGLPLWAFAEYVIAATSAVEALNLDGGVSTQIAVRDGDFTLRVRGVRGTINAVVVRAPNR